MINRQSFVSQTTDETTFEIGQAILTLNDGLQFTLQHSGNEKWYLVEDESQSKVFRIGLPQYTLLSLLNGRRTLAEATAKTSILLGPDSIDESELARLSHWIVESGLAKTKASQSQERLRRSRKREDIQQALSFLNPISVRIKLFNPDNFVTVVERIFRPVPGWLFACLWTMVVVYGVMLFATHCHEFFNGRLSSISNYDLLWFSGAWIVLKLAHEFSHAFVCKRLGGRVPQAGVLMLLLVPLPYVDVTSSWRFENKYWRIFTSSAGMISELFLAAIAVFIWVYSEPGPLRFHAGNIIIAATLHTLLFNANPLMRFDGYYILSDALEIPNLYTRGRGYVKRCCKKLFFGTRPILEKSRDNWIVKAYGWSALLWQIFICLSLSVAAINLLGGIGVAMAVVAAIFWIGIPLFRLAKFLVVGNKTEKPKRVRFSFVCLLLAAGVTTFLILVPAPTTVTIPVMVDFDDLMVVRAETNGFVKTIHMQSGDEVRQGQIILQLFNPELVSELEQVQIELEKAELESRMIKAQGEISPLQQQEEVIVALSSRKRELEILLSKLAIQSPISGVISSRELQSLHGTYVQPGDELVQVGSNEKLKLIGLVDQGDARWLKSQSIQLARARIFGNGSRCMKCKIQKIPPRAFQNVRYAVFAASNGGPLAVVQQSSAEVQVDADALPKSKDSLTGMKFLRPQVEVALVPLKESATKCYPGQTGIARVRARNDNLGSYIWKQLFRVVFKNLEGEHGL